MLSRVNSALNGNGGVTQNSTGTLTLAVGKQLCRQPRGQCRHSAVECRHLRRRRKVVINPNSAVNFGATAANPITLAGGTLGSFGRGTGNGTNLTTGDVTVTANSTVKTGDTQVSAPAAAK